jgi:NlpC/P60 family putative phage cell wall peptidase
MPRRVDIVSEAQRWLGTPYQHQASALGAGCDCLGLVRGVWRAVIGPEPTAAPPYTPDWAERHGAETLRDAAKQWLTPIDVSAAQAGDVILFRMFPEAPMKHCAILLAPDLLIHAYWARAVVKSRFGPWWRVRAAAAFSFPGVMD